MKKTIYTFIILLTFLCTTIPIVYGTESEAVESQSIKNGVYKIKTCVDEEKYIDVNGSSKANGANVQIWENENGANQTFQITYLNNGYYKIQAKHSDKVLDVESAGKANGTNVWQYEYDGSSAQQWKIEKVAEGKYRIVSKCNSLCLDVDGAKTDNGTNIQVYEWNESDAQIFDFEGIEIKEGKDEKPEKIEEPEESKELELQTPESRLEDGAYKINTKVDSKKYVDINGSSKANGANVQIWENENGTNQIFQIIYLNNGYYKIQAKHSEKVLDVKSAGKENGTNVWQYEYNGTDAQQWKIEKIAEGQYRIMSKCNGLYLDVDGAKPNNGTNIQVYEWNGSDAQLFNFGELEEKEEKPEQIEEPEIQTPESSLEDGIYRINTKVDSKKYIDINASSKVDGANAQIWENENGFNQRFQITYLNNGYYKIQAMHSDKVLDVKSAGKANGTNVWQYEYNGSDAQQWKIEKIAEGKYRIVSKCNDLCLDVDGAKPNNGTNIQVYEWNGSNAQLFNFEKIEHIKGKKTIEDGIYKIRLSSTQDMLVSVNKANKDNGANVYLEKDNEYKSQKYTITYLNNGFYKIGMAHSNKVLDVESAGKTNGTNVWQYEYNGSDAQQWIIQETEDGCYNIISKCNELYLDVFGGIANNGINIQTYSGHGGNSQKFYFDETEVQAIDSGLYEIQMAKDSNKVLEVSNGSSQNEANVQIGERQNSNYQKFYIEYDGKKKNYKVTMAHSQKVLDVCGGHAVIETNVWQYESNDTKAQRWKIVDFGDNNYNIISECGNGDLALDVYGASTNNGANVQIYTINNSMAQKFKIIETELNKSSFANLDNQRYPRYKEQLEKLQAQHPNWTINIKYTGIDWNTAVEAENQKDGNIPYSKTDQTGEWRHQTDTAQYSSGWYRASKEAIAYMMDPRNSLDDGYVFQFQDLTSNSGSYNDILRMISGTFLTRYSQWSTNDIINAILGAAQINNVSPFHITARILQEQGNNGNSLNGYNYEGTIVYNLFNINDNTGEDAGTFNGRARHAYKMQWFSPITCIMGSTHFLRSNYFDRGQVTLYYQKYNVVSEPLFGHQYMQNIRAANDEGKRVSNSYKASGLIDSEFSFEIPVYENMPSNPCSRPRS